jgi:hypothetical protein
MDPQRRPAWSPFFNAECAVAAHSRPTLGRMKSTLVLALTAGAFWALILMMGFAGIDGVRSQNVPGFPSDGQLRYYLYFPAAVLALVVTTGALSIRFAFLRTLVILVAVAALLCLPCYLIYYTGGV